MYHWVGRTALPTLNSSVTRRGSARVVWATLLKWRIHVFHPQPTATRVSTRAPRSDHGDTRLTHTARELILPGIPPSVTVVTRNTAGCVGKVVFGTRIARFRPIKTRMVRSVTQFEFDGLPWAAPIASVIGRGS